MPWDDDRLDAVEAEAKACATGDACTADVLALVGVVRQLRGLVWGLVPGDHLDRGGCWCHDWRSPMHEPECERLRSWFAEQGAPPMRRDVGQVGNARQGR
jgi:hypothetical protein